MVSAVALVELHVVGGHVERVHAEVSHVLGEMGQVAAVAPDRVFRQKHVADPRHQRPGGVLAPSSVAGMSRARKAETFSSTGWSPSNTSIRSGTSGSRLAGPTSWTGTSSVLMVIFSLAMGRAGSFSRLSNLRQSMEHKAYTVPW